VERPDLGRTGGSRGANRPAPGTETYAPLVENPFLDPLTDPLSTFGVDVDRASFALVRRFLNEGRLPPREAVRIEELVNYFTYDYAPPRAGETFAVQLEAAGCPWNPGHRLVRVGLRTRDLAPTGRPPCNLVFLVDASGSMDAANKLPLLKQALRMLVERLRPEDSVAIVTYADHSRVVLPPTRGDRAGEILAVLDGLRAGGSTNGGSGLRSAYALARETFREGGVNRVILCTDGDFNVGITDPAELVRVIRDEARSGVFLSVLGFGVGNLKDATMERLADEGDGNYAYVDTLNEAHRVLVGQMNATLVTVALDVKAQVEFNPAQVQRYRLIGYENRLLAAAAFNDDRQDAGDVGAGHQVTALYELEPVPGGGHRSGVDPLKYQPGVARPRPVDASAETLTLKVRYRESAGTASRLLEVPAVDAGRGWSQASPDLRFAASVAAFGMVLRDSPHRGNATLAGVLELAREGLGADPDGNRAAFLELVRRAREIAPGR
jgi:secreted protein with Ig-like and vWFA domain